MYCLSSAEKGVSTKLFERFEGPYNIVKLSLPTIYLLDLDWQEPAPADGALESNKVKRASRPLMESAHDTGRNVLRTSSKVANAKTSGERSVKRVCGCMNVRVCEELEID